MNDLSNPYSFPPLILREWSRISAKGLGGHSLRALWAEASFLVFSKLRSGVHLQILEKCIREQLCVSLGSYYRLSYLLSSLRVLRNLCSNNIFENLPIVPQYRKLRKDHFMLARFEIDMYMRYRDISFLRAKATDGDIKNRIKNFASFDETANGLLNEIEHAAQRKIDDAYARNWQLLSSHMNFSSKEAEYIKLKGTWEKPTTSRACKAGPQYHVPKQPSNAARKTLKTPSPRMLKCGGEDRQVMDPPNSPDTTTRVGNSNGQAMNHGVASGKTVKKVKNFDVTSDGEKDPFYEPGDTPRLLPRGADPLKYLTTFGYPPPPLFRLSVPDRVASPSDFGTPLV